MTHDHPTRRTSLLSRFTSGHVVVISALLGLGAGSLWSFGELPEQFQDIYVTIYRTLALPFLVLTIVHAIIRLRSEAGPHPVGRRILLLLPLAMLLAAVVSIAVTLALSSVADKAIASGIGPLVAAFDEAEANIVEITLAVTETEKPSLLARVAYDFVPENIFHSLATANVGQVVVFLIIFSIAILRLTPALTTEFVEIVGAARHPLERLMEAMQFLVPVAVFLYAIHASHALSAEDFAALRFLFAAVCAASLSVFVLSVLLVSVITRKSPLSVAADLKASALAGMVAVSEEAALPEMVRRIGHNDSADETKEIVASLGLTIGRFGMVAILASVLTYTLALYELPATPGTLGGIAALSVLSAALISGLNGPGVFAAALVFCGTELSLPVEALGILVIVLEPILELMLIPVSVAVTHALVVVATRGDQMAEAHAAPPSAPPAVRPDA